MGTHPPTGLAPSFLYSAEISGFISCRRGSDSLYFLYFSWMPLIWGAILAILSDDFMLDHFSGNMATLMIRVTMTMDHPQFGTQWSCVHFSHRNSGLAINPRYSPKSTRPSRLGPSADARAAGASRASSSLLSDACTVLSTSRVLGPTKMRSSVGPLALPTAAPSTV